MKTYCLTLDLQDDPKLIAEYKWYHQPENVWPEVVGGLRSQGILSEEIYLLGARLCMILRTTDEFSFAAKSFEDLENPKMQEWEALMWKYQRPLPNARPGEKWVLMERIFQIGSTE